MNEEIVIHYVDPEKIDDSRSCWKNRLPWRGCENQDGKIPMSNIMAELFVESGGSIELDAGATDPRIYRQEWHGRTRE